MEGIRSGPSIEAGDFVITKYGRVREAAESETLDPDEYLVDGSVIHERDLLRLDSNLVVYTSNYDQVKSILFHAFRYGWDIPSNDSEELAKINCIHIDRDEGSISLKKEGLIMDRNDEEELQMSGNSTQIIMYLDQHSPL